MATLYKIAMATVSSLMLLFVTNSALAAEEPYAELLHKDNIIEELHTLPENLRIQVLCLSMTIYREARGESLIEREVVAEVTLNRVGKSEFAANVCEVVYQVNHYHNRRVAQYSWTVHKNRHQIKEVDAWLASQKLAYFFLTSTRRPHLCSATYFKDCKALPKRMSSR